MTVKINVTELDKVGRLQKFRANRAKTGINALVSKFAEEVVQIARVEVPVSEGREHDRRRGGDTTHLRDTIGWRAVGLGGVIGAVVGPMGEYGEDIGSLVTSGTIKKNYPIAPREDGPGYLAWPDRARVSPHPLAYGSSHQPHYEPVIHPGFDGDDFMGRAFAAVLPKFQRDLLKLGYKLD